MVKQIAHNDQVEGSSPSLPIAHGKKKKRKRNATISTIIFYESNIMGIYDISNIISSIIKNIFTIKC